MIVVVVEKVTIKLLFLVPVDDMSVQCVPGMLMGKKFETHET